MRLKPDKWIRPKLILEIQFESFSISPTYRVGQEVVGDRSGLSLRFPRFVRFRNDKSIDQITSEQEVIDLYRKSII